MSVMEELILTHQKCIVSPKEGSIFSLLGHKRVIGLKRNQLYTPTVHQLSPHHRVKISFSSSLQVGGGQAARIWKSQGK